LSSAYIKSSPKTLKLVNFSPGSEKGAKNSCGCYPTELVFEAKNEKITPVKPKAEVSNLKGSFKNREDVILIWRVMISRQTAA
jgi:hypothetical protein